MHKKFKLNDELAVAIYNQPKDLLLEGVFHNGDAPFDRIISFVFSVDEMETYLQKVLKDNSLVEQGYLFFVYPKKGNKDYEQFIHRDEIFPAIQVDEEKYIVGSDLKFASLMSLNETFSILSIKRDGKGRGKKKTASSQCVSDYESMIPQLRDLLAENPSDLVFYDGLTPGYQKDWARYVYSAKKQDTQVARLKEMREIIRLGYKTKDLYRKVQAEANKSIQ
ncbi:YdeI/OmpD-associated family protein [Lysinibacillus cavernae]|uniref:YdeI/OmpD-associated family protein n=1 Tax=Lysinibacillus cavernae TaxID=2666135 RepID=UPI0012D98E08|nr:YdeI/OmpD-associated family protein [Lysinibacillus cavernae]